MPKPALAVVGPSIPAEPPKHTHVTLGSKPSRLAAAIRATAVRMDHLGAAATPKAIADAKEEAKGLPALVLAWLAEVEAAEAASE